MSTKIPFVLLALSLVACGGRTARSGGSAAPEVAQQSEPATYTYRVKASYPHPTDAYTQGFLFADGILWEGTGQYGQSVVRTTDLASGRSRTVAQLPRSEFGEGIALLDGKLYQLTWHANTCHVYDAASMTKLRDFRYPGEGWGLTTDGRKLYMSDGSARIYTVDPATFRREKRTTVTYKGQPVDYLNELEWIEGKIWANVYTTEQIVIIDPASGVVEGVVDLAGILPPSEHGPETDVLNGIAYDAEAKRIFVTGKNWSRIFEIEILPR
ncbi:MAG: glutaminyl-peptide cyclotransferase [Alistipes sp.]|nr:glutaminyl-peptide cyclotransferase [Alistipes sp.]